MASGRIGANVAEASVERDKEAAITSRRCEDFRIRRPNQTFAGDRVGVVPELLCDDRSQDRNVLVELDPHPDVGLSGYSSSRANKAP